MKINFREIDKNDYPFLRQKLYETLFVPEGKEPYPFSIIDLPEISKYIDNWGKKDDFGLIAMNMNEPIGAVWARLFDENNRGYGFVDNYTPELCIAVKPEYRNIGLGGQLLEQLFIIAKAHGFQTLSLSVDKQNRALNLYVRMGFEIVGEVDNAFTMKKEI